MPDKVVNIYAPDRFRSACSAHKGKRFLKFSNLLSLSSKRGDVLCSHSCYWGCRYMGGRRRGDVLQKSKYERREADRQTDGEEEHGLPRDMTHLLLYNQGILKEGTSHPHCSSEPCELHGCGNQHSPCTHMQSGCAVCTRLMLGTSTLTRRKANKNPHYCLYIQSAT